MCGEAGRRSVARFLPAALIIKPVEIVISICRSVSDR